MITLKYPNRVDTSVLDGIGLTIKRSGDVVVITGMPDRVDTAEAILGRLDVPPPPPSPAVPKKDIQLTAYLIIASPSGTQGVPLPKELESPVSQVASVFPYKSFNLFDAIIVRGADGDGGTWSGTLPQGQQTFPGGGSYLLQLRRIEVSPATPANLIRLGMFDLGVSIVSGVDKEGKDKIQHVGLQTAIDMKEGQKVVVGKANVDGSANALIVILTAKVAD
jgi:hypothetical protein